MTTTTFTPETNKNGWPIIRAEFRNDDPIALDDSWHRGSFWRFTVKDTDGVTMICEEGSSYYADPNSWCHASDRIEAKLKAMGFTVAEKHSKGECSEYTTIVTLS